MALALDATQNHETTGVCETSFVFGIPDPLILMLFEQSLCLNTYVKHESGQGKKILN